MNTIPNKNYYVTMTDSFMSDWGRAKGKINKFVVGCDTHLQAKLIHKTAKQRPEMKYVNLLKHKPFYNKRQYLSFISELQST